MSHHRVVALVREAADQARIRGALRGRGALLPCSSPNEVLAALADDAGALAVVVSAYGPAVDEAVALTRALRARHPTIPVLVYYEPRYSDARRLLEFFQAGAAEIVQSDREEELRRVFASVLATAGQRVASRRVIDSLDPLLPPEARRLIEYLLEAADEPLTIEEAAAAVGLKRRTLEKRLAQLGYPAPETLIGWCRLLLAAHLLEDQQRTFDDVAMQLDFPSGMALRSMLKRYTGVSGRDARRSGGPLALVLTQLRAKLTTPEAAAVVARIRAAL
jgi:AraC-like DNA-binding protein